MLLVLSVAAWGVIALATGWGWAYLIFWVALAVLVFCQIVEWICDDEEVNE